MLTVNEVTTYPCQKPKTRSYSRHTHNHSKLETEKKNNNKISVNFFRIIQRIIKTFEGQANERNIIIDPFEA